MADAATLRCPDGKHQEQHDSSKVQSNLSGLKHALHGMSYQMKLGIVVCLANAKKSMDPANNFTFTVTAEDPTAGKFDDIVYTFKDGEKTGTLYIQAKHKLGSPAPTIAVKDFTTNSDTKNAFAILKYFTSFCDQQPSTTDLEGFIICTNTTLDEKAKGMWKPVERTVTDGSATTLDSYISALFDSSGGKCYQLDYVQLLTTYCVFYQSLNQCSKRARLARLLVDNIKSSGQKHITYSNSLYRQCRQAILDVIDRREPSTNGSYGFTKEFLDSSSSSSKQGYEAFRKEFEDQYRQEFKIDGSVWEDLQMKQLHVAKDFLSDEKNECASSDLFPDDDVNDSFKAFCIRFRLVCDTNNEHKLDDAITNIWRDLHHVDSNQQKGTIEDNLATERLFKTNFDWLMDPFAKPLRSEDIIKDLKNIENTLALMNLKGISGKLRKKVLGSPFRISAESLKASDLYEQMESDSYLDIETQDIKFCATFVSDILALQSKDCVCTLFFEDADFVNDSVSLNDTVEAVLRYYEQPICLIIICNEAIKVVQKLVRKWKKWIREDSTKQVLLIRETSDIPTDLSCFHICDLTEKSRKQLLGNDIPLCTTTISPAKIFQNSLHEVSIEEIIKVLDEGKQMEDNNGISRKYREIEDNYAHRYWIDQKEELKTENQELSESETISNFLANPHKLEWDETVWKKRTKLIKKKKNFVKIFSNANISENVHEPFVGDETKKILILLGEAGYGKSTNLTWLAWYLRRQNPSSWVVRCNLSEHCIDFKEFISDPKLQKSLKVIDETVGLRMLFKLAYSSIPIERYSDQICSECLDLTAGSVILNENRMKQHKLSFTSKIHLLVFAEKFNAGELVLLLDAFDEIAPHYKEVVLKFLFQFEQFKGVKKMYVTSRPYGFKEQFEGTLNDISFFKMNPLSLQQKGTMLFQMMKEKWHRGKIDDEEISVFYKWLCTMILCSLREMSDIPLNLVMAVDILGDLFYPNQNINKDTFTRTFLEQLFETIIDLSKGSFSVEEFVKIKIRHLLYDKNGANKNVALKPSEIDKFEKAIDEAKVQHGLVALWIFFDKSELELILTDAEKREAEDCIGKVHVAKEKTGIINAIQDGIPMFVHRIFAEYLAAWWIVNRRVEGTITMFNLKSFWKQYELRKYIDSILAKGYPLHLAIIERAWETVESLLLFGRASLYEEDEGNRTPLHLLAYYYDFTSSWPDFLPKSMDYYTINCKEKLFGWTALDFAFHPTKAPTTTYNCHKARKRYSQFINYLLHHGASINVDILYDQIKAAASVQKKVRQAARYAKLVMEYLSRQAIVYETHDACKRMKQLCDKVVHHLVNGVSENYELTTERNEKSIIEDIIREDSVWMMESVIQNQADKEYFVQMTRNSSINLALESKSIFVLRYFTANDPLMINENILRECIVCSVLNGYKIEFKYFFDLYCSQLAIKEFKACPIQNDEAGYNIDVLTSYVMNTVFRLIENVCWARLGIPTAIMINKNILSLLVICVVTVRPSMLRYLKESCKLNLGAGLVYCLAMVTNRLFSQIHLIVATKPNQAYACLLNQASNISDVDATNMFRLAITSENFVFSKCLIDLYNIDIQAVDESNGWNAFHLCVSRPPTTSTSVAESMFKLFRCMSHKVEMDFFLHFDRKGRSIFHLACENQHKAIAEYIVARKLGFFNINTIRKLGVEDIPKMTSCYRAILETSKSNGGKEYHHEVLCILVKQLADISLNVGDTTQGQNCAHLLLQEDAAELYQIAIKCKSLFLIYYFHREFKIASPINDADWLECTAKSLNSPNFLDVTKWLLSANGVNEHGELMTISYRILKKCDAEKFNLPPKFFNTIVKQVNANLSINRSAEFVSNVKLLILAICLKHELAIKYLCETSNVKIDQTLLFDIIKIAHHSTERCEFRTFSFDPIYKYLIDRTSDLHEIDALGRNILHRAVQSGPYCMIKFLIEQNVFDVMTVIEQNGWNILHCCASRKRSYKCGRSKKNEILICLFKKVLEITSHRNIIEDMTEYRKNKVKELSFNSNEGSKSVMYVAVEAGNMQMVAYIIKLCLGIDNIVNHTIKNSDECSRFKECYDMLQQIAVQLPFRAQTEMLLHSLARPIESFWSDNIKLIREEETVDVQVTEHVCRTAIKYRAVATLEHLIMHCRHQVNQSLAKTTGGELLACISECIRRNRISLFKVLVGHYRTLQGIKPSIAVEYEEQENDNYDNDKDTIDEDNILWSLVDQLTHDGSMNPEYQLLLILLVAHGRLSMIKYLDEMIQLVVNESLILLVMKVLKMLAYRDCKATAPVFEYLASRSEGKINLLKLCIHAGDTKMVRYLITVKKIDPNELDWDNGWNAGHYCVSEPRSSTNNTFKVFTYLMKKTKMNCFGVYDKNGRSAFNLALKNGHKQIANYIIRNKLGMQPWEEWDLEKIDVYINELQVIMELIPKNMQRFAKKQLIRVTDRKIVLRMYKELFNNQSL